MIKKLIIVCFISVFITSCVNHSQNNEVKEKPTELSINNFITTAPGLIGKKVVLRGIVDKICEKNVKIMFLTNENSNEFIRIIGDETIPSFNNELIGYEVEVEGTVQENVIENAYLNKLETLQDQSNIDLCEYNLTPGKIADLKKEMAESGKNQLLFYSIVCHKYERMKPREKEE